MNIFLHYIRKNKKALILNLIAKIFSVLFQPILMPIFCMLLVFETNPTISDLHSPDSKLLIYALSISFTIIFPLLVFATFYKLGLVTDVNLTKRNERVVPFFISIFLFGVFYYLVRYNNNYNAIIFPILFSSLIITLVANTITMFWKISIHCLGIASVLGTISGLCLTTVYPLSLYLIVGLTIIVLVIGISRVILKRHTILQVIAGTSLGFFGPFLAILFDVYI